MPVDTRRSLDSAHDQKDRNLLTILGALALMAGACTLPADDAGVMPIDEIPDGLAVTAEDLDAGHAEPDLVWCDLRVDYPHNPGTARAGST